MEATLKRRVMPSWKTGTLSGRRERLTLEPRGGVTTPSMEAACQSFQNEEPPWSKRTIGVVPA